MRFETRWSDATVVSKTYPVPDVCLLEIAPDGGAIAYTPGSHINLEVRLPGHSATVKETRSYSLVGEGIASSYYRIAVRRQPESRGGSLFVWSLEPGSRVRISNPQNLFELSFGRPEYLLVAGGIGITPIYGMACALARAGAAFRLLYCGRSREGMPFLGELTERLGPRLRHFCSAEGTRIDLQHEIARLDPDGELYMCGPVRLMDEIRRGWRQAGRPATSLRFETFGSSGEYAPEAFTVHIADRGVDVVVREDQTMLQALREAGVDVLADCLRGECGLCAVNVVQSQGPIDHRDVFLSDKEKAEGRRICTCVSRAVAGRLTVDTGYRCPERMNDVTIGPAEPVHYNSIGSPT